MTSGLISQGTLGSTQHGFYRQWDGGDGRYELSGGRKRDKWNDYLLVYMESRQNGNSDGSMNNCATHRFFDDVFTGSDVVRLQSKLASAVRKHDFNLAVNIATGTQTVNMVVDTLSKLRRSYIALKHGNLPEAARQLGTTPRPSRLKPTDVSGRWLELQYGWLPAISDTYEACKAYEVLTSGERTSTISVSRRVKSRFNGSQSPPNFSGWGDEVARMKIIYEASESLGAIRSLGLADPLSVVWEVIPYSFVVDWFIPIGSYLDNLSIIPALKGRFCTIKYFTYKNTTVPTPFGFLHGYDDFSGTFRRVTVDRFVSLSLEVERPHFVSLPQAMSPRRIWNAIALTAQAFAPSSYTLAKKAGIPRVFTR